MLFVACLVKFCESLSSNQEMICNRLKVGENMIFAIFSGSDLNQTGTELILVTFIGKII